jgi:hypothetical protein
MVEATGLKKSGFEVMLTEFRENPPIGSNLLRGKHRQAVYVTSLLSF